MPALDSLHSAAKNALIKSGWKITHDPLRLPAGRRNLFVDLGAEMLIGAEKGTRKIAVEIKTFSGRSEMADLEQAVGQYVIYRGLLRKLEPERTLYIAVPEDIMNTLFREVIGEIVLEEPITHLFAFDPVEETVVRWIPEIETIL